jgi:hypothetical protein
MPYSDTCNNFTMGDRTSSFRVGEGTIFQAYEHWAFDGKNKSFSYDVNDSNPIGWGDNMSSIKVKKDCNNDRWIWDNDCEIGRSNTENSGSITQKRQNRCNNANLNSDSQCKNWCLNNKDKCGNSLSSFCNDKNNVSSTQCKEWCKGPPARCDVGAADFCRDNPSNSTFCSCYDDNAKQALPQEVRNLAEIKNSRAICFSSKCATEGYVPSSTSILTSACPKCIQSIDFSNIQATDVIISKINQSCTISDGTPAPSFQSNNAPPGTKPKDEDDDKKLMYIFIGLLVFIFLIILLFIVSSGDDA